VKRFLWWPAIYLGSIIAGLLLGVAIFGILSVLFHLVGMLIDLHPHVAPRTHGNYHLVREEIEDGTTGHCPC